MRRGVSPAVIALIVIVIAVAASVALYYMMFNKMLRHTPTVPVKLGAVYVEGVKSGIGYIDIYVLSTVTTKVDTVYLQRCGSTTSIAAIKLPHPITLVKGSVTLIHIPLVNLGINPASLPNKVCISLGTSKGITAVGATAIDIAKYLELASRRAVIGFIAGRDTSCALGDRRVNPSDIEWFYINLVTGSLEYRLVVGGKHYDYRGRATFLYNKTVLDLRAMSWEQRFKLGPAVIVVNPYLAAKDFVFRVIDIYGHVYTFDLKKLVPNPDEVALDILVLWEDLWSPIATPSTASLDNYVDHVVRVTVFTNNTVRIEVLHASGCFIHFFVVSPPPFDEIPKILEQYMKNGFRLPESDGIVYVKTHGAAVPPIGPDKIWDPVNGEWVTSWPPVFYKSG